jgi:hypothetical protein
MDPASTINFLSNENTQELAPGLFIIIGMAVGNIGKSSRDSAFFEKQKKAGGPPCGIYQKTRSTFRINA